MRVVLVSGKGGVGKTTVSAATAVHCALRGYRTLVVSTDGAHSLADVFGEPIGHAPEPLGTNLWGQQLDTQLALEQSWAAIHGYLADLLEWAGAGGVAAEELLVVPGMHEVFALENVLVQARSGDYDRIVVDCAPTAETLRLLELPEVFGWYLERLFPKHRKLARITRPMLRHATDMPLAQDPLFEAALSFANRMSEVRSLLADHETTCIRLVTTPEGVVVDEARRLQAHLRLFGYAVDSIVVNRILSAAERGTPLLDGWHDRQRRELARIDESFDGLRRFSLGLRAQEPVGVPALEALGAELYGETDSLGPVDPSPSHWVEASAEGPVLNIALAACDPSDLNVKAGSDEVIVTAGGHRRRLGLPESLCDRTVTRAGYDGECVRLTFEPRPSRSELR